MKTFFPFFLLFSIMFFFETKAFSQIELSGYVFDPTDNKPISGAKIQIEGTLFGSVTDKNGKYKISKIPHGWYSIMVMSLGYETFKIKIFLNSDTTINFKLSLKEISKPEIVVSASKRLQTISDVPVSMTILEQDYFKIKNYVELKEYLKFLPSVDFSNDNISIRGSSGYQFGSGSRVTLLLDGFPIIAGDIGEANVNIFPPGIISRVEILKGAGSAVYGNSAMSGVVNLITKEAEENVNFQSQIYSGVYTQPKYKEWRYTDILRTKNSISMLYTSSTEYGNFFISGQFINDESYRKFNRSNSFNFYGKFLKQINNGTKIRLFTLANYRHSDDATFWNGAFKATIPPDNYDLSRRLNRSRNAIGGEFLSTIGKHSFFSFKSSLYITDFESNLPKTDINYRQSNSYSNFNEFQINHHLFENSLVTSGFTVVNNWVNSYQYGKRKQTILSGLTQGEFTILQEINSIGGIRFDYDISDSSKKYFEISPRFGTTFSLFESFILRTSLGKGFRVATISERFSSIRHSGFTIEPNPDLSPEKSWNFELGSNLSTYFFGKKIIFDCSIFYTKYKNLIEPQFDTNASTPTIRYRNIAQADIKGFEFSINSKLSKKFEANFNLVFLDPIDLQIKDILKFRSRFYITSGFILNLTPVNISAQYKFVSRIVKVEEQLRFILKDYDVRVPIHLVDLNVNLDLKNFYLPFEINFTVQNLLDYYYVDLVGNLAPTRFISFGVKYNYSK